MCQAARPAAWCWSRAALGLCCSPLSPPYLLPFLPKLRTVHKRGAYCQDTSQKRRLLPGQGAVPDYSAAPGLPREALERSSVLDEKVHDAEFRGGKAPTLFTQAGSTLASRAICSPFRAFPQDSSS